MVIIRQKSVSLPDEFSDSELGQMRCSIERLGETRSLRLPRKAGWHFPSHVKLSRNGIPPSG